MMGGQAAGGYHTLTPVDFWQTLMVAAMDMILSAAAAVAIVMAVVVVGATRTALWPTTLISAWTWALGAVVAWGLTAIGDGMLGPSEAAAPVFELLWFAVALFSLCPAVAVLGARRPGAGAWNGFVLMPLLAVLGWPILAVLAGGFPLRPLELEAPQLIGLGIVLLMGASNYVGTKYGTSAGLYALAVCLLLAPLSGASSDWLSPQVTRALGSCVLGLSAIVAGLQRDRPFPSSEPFDRLWEDYRNTFGVVWAHRLRDRFNTLSRQKKWSVELTAVGFRWDDAVSAEQRRETTGKIEQSLRWMLRRFVNPEWIDQRLTTTSRS